MAGSAAQALRALRAVRILRGISSHSMLKLLTSATYQVALHVLGPLVLIVFAIACFAGMSLFDQFCVHCVLRFGGCWQGQSTSQAEERSKSMKVMFCFRRPSNLMPVVYTAIARQMFDELDDGHVIRRNDTAHFNSFPAAITLLARCVLGG